MPDDARMHGIEEAAKELDRLAGDPERYPSKFDRRLIGRLSAHLRLYKRALASTTPAEEK